MMLPEAILASSWIHIVLFAVELMLAVRYLSQTDVDVPCRFKAIVGFLLINALAELFAVCAGSWKALIIPPAIPEMKHSWPLPMMVITTNIASATEQCFLAHRYYRLSGRILLTGFVVLMILVQTTVGLTTALDIVVNPAYGRRFTFIAIHLEYCIGAAVDIFIPILLIYELHPIRKTTYPRTKSLIRRIIVTAVWSGGCVALAQILVLILFWTRRSVMNLACTALGPLYGITILSYLFVWQPKASRATSDTKTGDLSTLPSLHLQPSISP